MDLERDFETDPVRRQFRRSPLDYMAGAKFRPRTVLTFEAARRVALEPPSAAGGRP